MSKNLSSQLSEIQADLKSTKNHYNKFGEYNYRSCEDILESVKPLLYEKELALVLSDELLLIGDRYYVKATAKLLNGEEEIVVTALAREDLERKKMQPEQLTGSASSYARKYALSGLFCIDDNKDADTMKPENEDDKKDKAANTPPAKKPPATFGAGLITAGQRKKIQNDYIVTKILTIDEIKEVISSFGYSSSSQIKLEDFKKILKALDAKVEANENEIKANWDGGIDNAVDN